MRVFLDTHSMIAMINILEPAHEAVSAYLAGYRGKIVTTECVLLEFADALAHPSARLSAVAAIHRLRKDPQFEIVPHDAAINHAGLDLYAKRPDKEWALTDCISFAVMTARGLTEALTADHHFEQAGLIRLLPR